MTEARRPLVVGNWKMNGLAAGLAEAETVAAALRDSPSAARVALCPPATLLHRMAERLEGSAVAVGAQDCHPEPHGAFTGDLGAQMLHDAGATLVILGHSERRHMHREDDARVSAKVEAALASGLEPIVCVGETLEERRSGRAEPVVVAQVEASLPQALEGQAFSVAYEPVWAIGSGLTPTLEEIGAMHGAIRTALVRRFGAQGWATPILYGGSVKAANAEEILAVRDVDGALVGGASLKAADFLPIVRAAR